MSSNSSPPVTLGRQAQSHPPTRAPTLPLPEEATGSQGQNPGTSEPQPKGRVSPVATLFLASSPPFHRLPSPPPPALLSPWVQAGVRTGGWATQNMSLRGSRLLEAPGLGFVAVDVACFLTNFISQSNCRHTEKLSRRHTRFPGTHMWSLPRY